MSMAACYLSPKVYVVGDVEALVPSQHTCHLKLQVQLVGQHGLFTDGLHREHTVVYRGPALSSP